MAPNSRSILSYFRPRQHRLSEAPRTPPSEDAPAPQPHDDTIKMDTSEDELAVLDKPPPVFQASKRRTRDSHSPPPPRSGKRLKHVLIPHKDPMPTPPESQGPSDQETSRPRRAAARRAAAKRSFYVEDPPSDASYHNAASDDGSFHAGSDGEAVQEDLDGTSGMDTEDHSDMTGEEVLDGEDDDASIAESVNAKRKGKAQWANHPLFAKKPNAKQQNAKQQKVGRKPVQPSKTSNTKNFELKQFDFSRPPISDINDIFRHITERALEEGLTDTLNHLGGRELRVATMCSGTESPLLALEMVNQSLKDLGQEPLRIKHLFSAEIVPYKQAFIERNFSPPIIFRDIREFTEEGAKSSGATNVYGAKVPIPDNVDMLVAGFSCVDLSNLNNKKKNLTEGGESGDTFHAVHTYANIWRPRMIILENVCSAPWSPKEKDKGQPKSEDYYISTKMAKIGYECRHVKVDTKHYYLPHTRQRGYMVCIDRNRYGKNRAGATRAVERWLDLMKSMKYPASAPVSSFLLPTDDIRTEQLNSELTRQMRSLAARRNVSWEACAVRHDTVRAERRLGVRHPVTEWVKNGTCVSFDYGNRLWLQKQGERVWDTIDIVCMTGAQEKYGGGFDMLYKTLIMELSQNVDRGDPVPRFGICDCITPSGIHFLADRGGPLNAYELLALQGIPLQNVTFTTETSTQLQDLAGNAMSSTVVGIAEVAALIVGAGILDSETPEEVIPELSGSQDDGIRVCGQELLTPYNKDEALTHRDLTLASLCADAWASIRLCGCEGQLTQTDKNVYGCTKCENTVCSSCRSKPRHQYGPEPIEERMSPQLFEDRWKWAFPARFRFDGQIDMDKLKHNKSPFNDAAHWRAYEGAVTSAFESDLVFSRIKRGAKFWKIIYESSTAILELNIDHREAVWRFYAKPDGKLPGNSPLRRLLEHELARSQLPDAFLTNKVYFEKWHWHCVEDHTYKVNIDFVGKSIPSWRASYGLLDYTNEKANTKLEITVENPDLLAEDVSGVYELLPDCGTASRSLHRRIDEEGSTERPLYLFLDPTRLGPPGQDSFVFAHDHRRLEYAETRSVIGYIAPSWRPNYRGDSPHSAIKSPELRSAGHWVLDSQMPSGFQPVDTPMSLWSPPGNDEGWEVKASKQGCSHTHALTVLAMDADPLERQDNVDKFRHRKADGKFKAIFEDWAWNLHQVRHIPQLQDWRPLEHISGATELCPECGPKPPKIEWRQDVKHGKTVLVPQEEPEQAGQFERATKNRPDILYLQEVHINGKRRLEIGVNVMALAHRARSRLRVSATDSSVLLAWNLMTDYVPSAMPNLQPFVLRDNDNDAEHETPRGFTHPLKVEQKRSLAWMRGQEANEGAPFTLEEVEEEVVESLRWKIEARAQTEVNIKGGVLADEVSYGKTITTLALIHSEFLDWQRTGGWKPPPPTQDEPQLIDLKATLVIAPSNMTTQWRTEIEKFLPAAQYGAGAVLVIRSLKDLEKLRIKNFVTAKVIVVTWTVLTTEGYMERLQKLTAMPEAPSTEGRAFTAWLEYALTRMPRLVHTLKHEGIAAFKEKLRQEEIDNAEDEVFKGVVPSKRMKGQAYMDLKKAKTAKAKAAIANRKKPQPKARSKPSSSSASNWQDYDGPVLNMFRFNRIVIDEFTYPRKKSLVSLMALQAEKRWVLSGTPPLDDFADVKRIGSFLGIKLGVDCDAPFFITRHNSRVMQEDQTNTEKFQAFRQKRSTAWHARRHAYAQNFLDHFVRQNAANIGEVECFEYLKPASLRMDHHAAYIELLQYLNMSSMQIKPPPVNACGDRKERMKSAFKSATTPEEVLSNCAAYHEHDGPQSGCDAILATRQREYMKYRNDIKNEVAKADRFQRTLKSSQGDPLTVWKSTFKTGDPEIQETLEILIQEVSDKGGPTKQKVGVDEEKILYLRKLVRDLREMTKELVSRKRAVRFIENYSALSETLYCDGCGAESMDPADVNLLTECGHRACSSCLAGHDQHADESADESVAAEPEYSIRSSACVVDGCDVTIESYHVLNAEEISGNDSAADQETHGEKLDQIIELLKDESQVKRNERAILFVPSYQMMHLVECALKSAGITFFAIEGTNAAADTDAFKQAGDRRDSNWRKVILLNLSDESAAGLNLTMTNHVLFLAPLLESTSTKYHAAMTQAIGRTRRYGQKQKVHIYRFVALNTVDVDVLEQRERRTVPLVEGRQPMAAVYKPILRRGGKAEDPDGRKFEKTKLVQDWNGGVALIPESLAEGKQASLTSLIYFSEAYAGDEEQ